MISIQPQSQFAIVRQLADHTDITTYYVQAVIRNSISDEIIDTINLTDKTGGRFLKTWEVPADVSGFGFYIDITTSVYSDSGYTTKATAYGDELEDYLVFDRIKGSGGGGGGADIDVDYKKIEKILIKTIEPLTSLKNIDLGPVLKKIEGVINKVDGIKIPPPENINLIPALEAIRRSEKNIVKSISEKEVIPKTDLEEVKGVILQAIANKNINLSDVINNLMEIKKIVDGLQHNIDDEKTKEIEKENKLKEKEEKKIKADQKKYKVNRLFNRNTDDVRIEKLLSL